MHEWEDITDRVAKSVVWEKMIVCGKSELDGGIMCEVYKKVVRGRKELWGEYHRLHKEVEEAVMENSIPGEK